ncbi:MAG: NAD(P)/FAD-dependent oxidoreductase [Saprospiraceae bacterium]|nr:NAD(P)/FAD-dependent oxidoreductase [Saprospiraceae bacterium]
MSDVYIPPSEHPRIVLIGAGFAGLYFAKKLRNKPFQVVLIDKNNFHQFQPLFYQVATSGLEPDAITFSVRKIFRNCTNVIFRMADVQRIDTEGQTLETDIGTIDYDYLVLATGATNNFYGMDDVEAHSMGFKSIQESLDIRSLVLQNLEKAANTSDLAKKERLTNIVIVGGGPAGVEMAGAFAEFHKFNFRGDYHDIDPGLFKVFLIEAGPSLLPAMSKKSSKSALNVLERLGVHVHLNTAVEGYDGQEVRLGDTRIASESLIWTAGIKAQYPFGLERAAVARGHRLTTDQFNKVQGYTNIYAIGDVAYMETQAWPDGHPQVAPAAIQHGEHLAKNLLIGDPARWKPFKYFDKGALATIGKKRAVMDVGKAHAKGFIGWFIWATVHLFSISGFKNRLRVGVNWINSYFSYDKRNRLIIRKYEKEGVK